MFATVAAIGAVARHSGISDLIVPAHPYRRPGAALGMRSMFVIIGRPSLSDTGCWIPLSLGFGSERIVDPYGLA